MCFVRYYRNGNYQNKGATDNVVDCILNSKGNEHDQYDSGSINLPAEPDEMKAAIKAEQQTFRKDIGNQMAHVVITFNNEEKQSIRNNVGIIDDFTEIVGLSYDSKGYQNFYCVNDDGDLNIHYGINPVSYINKGKKLRYSENLRYKDEEFFTDCLNMLIRESR